MKKYLIFILLLASSAFGQVTGITVANSCGLAQECGAVIASIGTGSAVMNNNTYLKWRNAAGSANINVLKVDASDDTVLASDTGDTVIIAPAGTTDLTITAAQTAISSANYQVVPGSSSYTIRNNADDTNNFLFNNDGSMGLHGTNPRITSSAGLILGVDADAQRLFTFDASSDTALTQTFGDSGVTAAQQLTISGSTSDTDDDSTLIITPGGGSGTDRGFRILGYGNEAAGAGGAFITTGNVATADLNIGAQDDIIFEDLSGADSLVIDTATKAAGFTGAVTSSATGALGWAPVAGANTACNTTCTSACVFGIDSAAPQTWLACTNATADMCLCAGAS